MQFSSERWVAIWTAADPHIQKALQRSHREMRWRSWLASPHIRWIPPWIMAIGFNVYVKHLLPIPRVRIHVEWWR